MVKSSSGVAGLLRVAALAAVLVPFIPAPAESAAISCVTEAASTACTGAYTAGGGEQSNRWKFYTDGQFDDLIYTIEIAGTPLSNFSLTVSDFVTDEAAFDASGALVNFPDTDCTPTRAPGTCGLFNVVASGGSPSWQDGYLLTINWFSNEDPSSQPDTLRNTILEAHGASPIFENELASIVYNPSPTPLDPGISGRGDSFSTFGVFSSPALTAVPEPASLLLVGVGLAGAVARRRRSSR